MHEHSTHKKVLIVDDDQFLVDMYATKFKEAGFEVEISLDSRATITKLRDKSSTPDILLTDIVMPDLDGFAMLDIIRKEGLCPTATIIVLSNQGQPSDMEKATALGADGYIIKANSIPSEVVAQVLETVKKKTDSTSK